MDANTTGVAAKSFASSATTFLTAGAFLWEGGCGLISHTSCSACRLCHDEKVFKHAFDRFATDTVRCNSCGTVQPFGQQCTNAECQRSFGSTYCVDAVRLLTFFC